MRELWEKTWAPQEQQPSKWGGEMATRVRSRQWCREEESVNVVGEYWGGKGN